MKCKWLAVVLAAVLFSGVRLSAQEATGQPPVPPPGEQVQETPPPPSLNRQLAQAVARGQVEEVSALLTAGADPQMPLRIAATYGQAEIFKLLVDHGARLTGPDNPGDDYLRMALYGSNKKVQERDAQNQAKRAAEGKVAIQNGGGYNEIIKILLEHGVPADSTNQLGFTPLMEASMWGNETAVSLLLEHGAKTDTELREEGGTALSGAAWFGFGKIVELLLKAGASPDAADSEKATPLLRASCAGSPAAMVLTSGGKSEGYAYLMKVRGNEFGRAVRALIAAGANPNLGNKRDVTPLMASSLAGNLDIATALLDAGADPNLRDKEGRTALMFATKSGQPALVELLLSRKADPKAVALDGKTALAIAKGGKSRETIQLLQKSLKF